MVATGIVGFRLSRPRGARTRVRVEQGRLPLRNAGLDARRPAGRYAPRRGHLPQPPGLQLRGDERVHDHGATLLSDIEAQTPSILFWRSMTHWLGGIGIVVLFVAVAPLLGVGAARLIGAEMSGLTSLA